MYRFWILNILATTAICLAFLGEADAASLDYDVSKDVPEGDDGTPRGTEGEPDVEGTVGGGNEREDSNGGRRVDDYTTYVYVEYYDGGSEMPTEGPEGGIDYEVDTYVYEIDQDDDDGREGLTEDLEGGSASDNPVEGENGQMDGHGPWGGGWNSGPWNGGAGGGGWNNGPRESGWGSGPSGWNTGHGGEGGGWSSGPSGEGWSGGPGLGGWNRGPGTGGWSSGPGGWNNGPSGGEWSSGPGGYIIGRGGGNGGIPSGWSSGGAEGGAPGNGGSQGSGLDGPGRGERNSRGSGGRVVGRASGRRG